MKRYIVTPISGDGLTPDTAYSSSLREAAASHPSSLIAYAAKLKIDSQTGMPIWNFAFCRAATGDGPSQAIVEQVTNSLVFPDFPLDAPMSGMDQATRTAWRQSLQAYDIDGQGTHIAVNDSDGETWGSVLQRLVQMFEPSQIITRFDVAEPTA